MQSIFVRFDGDFSEQQVLQALGRPGFAHQGGNIMSIGAGPAGAGTTVLFIQGFEHMGAGDVDC